MNQSAETRKQSSERRCRKLESDEIKEIEALLGSANSIARQAVDFVEYVANLDQPVPAEVSLRILKSKARELLKGEA
jgi:hypothetical protein